MSGKLNNVVEAAGQQGDRNRHGLGWWLDGLMMMAWGGSEVGLAIDLCEMPARTFLYIVIRFVSIVVWFSFNHIR